MSTKFQVGQRVRVVRKVPADAYYADLTGLESTIAEIDEIKLARTYDVPIILQVNYTLASGNYVHEEELEAVEESTDVDNR